MNVPGHLATAYLLARRGEAPRLAERIAPTCLGAMLPDLADKPAMWAGLTPYGRTLGHSVLAWALVALLWIAANRPRRIGFVLLGGLSHLVVDLVDDAAEGLERSGYVFSAWFGWPLTNPDMWSVASPHVLSPMPFAVTALEMATVAACLWHVVRQRGSALRLAR